MRSLLALVLSAWACVASGQSWQAASTGGRGVPLINANGQVVLPIPDSHKSTSLVAFLTTTNSPRLLGNLVGSTISATIQLDATNNPILWFGNDCGHGALGANVRLYFTTTVEPYNVAHANANETNYWWADYAFSSLSASNWSSAIPETWMITARLRPALWSDALGHYASDTNYTASFYQAASHVAQVGLSFGGGCYFDVGVGVFNPDTPQAGATLTLLSYCVDRPRFNNPKTLSVSLVPETITIAWDWCGTNTGVTFNVWEYETNCPAAPNRTTWHIVANVPDMFLALPVDKSRTGLTLWSVTATNATERESDFSQ